MSLEQLGKEVQAFVRESQELTSSFKNFENELNEKVSQGLRGAVEAKQEIDNKKSEIYGALQEKAKKLEGKKESIMEIELKTIEETSESITADTLAELQLLSQLNLSQDDMREYINKYKHTPLALRKLKEIAQGNKQFFSMLHEFPADRKEQLNVVLGRMSNHLSRFQRPNFADYEVKTGMIADGAVNGIDEDVSYYRSL